MKTYVVRRSLRAEADLKAIYAYVAQDSPAAADRLLRKLHGGCAGLDLFPERNRIRPELGQGARMLVIGSYVVLYRVTDEDVQIVRIMHGSQDLRGVLG